MLLNVWHNVFLLHTHVHILRIDPDAIIINILLSATPMITPYCYIIGCGNIKHEVKQKREEKEEEDGLRIVW